MFKHLSAAALVAAVEANWRSGEVKTLETFKYGKFVTKMQGADKLGTITSFFTYWKGPNWTAEGWNEIDVELVPSKTENPYSTNIIWTWQQQDQGYDQGFLPGTDWHTYAVEWTPDYVAWFVDDKEIRRVTGTDDVHFLNKDCVLMMNFWTPTWDDWGHGFDPAGMPWYARYDFVETYTYDESMKQFNLKWRDDFDSFDESRWLKSDNWGFDSNSTTFWASQVSVEDGALVLKMEPPTGDKESTFLQ